MCVCVCVCESVCVCAQACVRALVGVGGAAEPVVCLPDAGLPARRGAKGQRGTGGRGRGAASCRCGPVAPP